MKKPSAAGAEGFVTSGRSDQNSWSQLEAGVPPPPEGDPLAKNSHHSTISTMMTTITPMISDELSWTTGGPPPPGLLTTTGPLTRPPHLQVWRSESSRIECETRAPRS